MFHNTINALNNYMMHHTHYGILFAFLVALAESLPLLGTIIPGSITMTIIGILVGRNVLPFTDTILWASLGALLGDILGFWIGKYYNERLRNMWPFRKHPKWLTLGENFFESHGGKSILIGRFVGPARSTVPLIAGLLKMTWGRFLLAAIPSAVLWSLAYMLPGVLIGAISLELPPAKTTAFMLIGLAIIVGLWLVFWAIQRFFVFLANFINRWIDRLWNWLNRHHSSKFIIRAITNQARPTDHHQLTLVLIALLSALIFLFIIINVTTHSGLFHLNSPIFHLLQSIRNPRLDNFFVTFTLLGDKTIIIPTAFLIIVILAAHKQWRVSLHLLILIALAAASIWLFKHIITSPRPEGFMRVKTSFSFPSGHTVLATTIFGFLSYIIAQHLKRQWHWIPYTMAGLIISLVFISRIYLGAHWLCDVLAGLGLGIALLLAIIVSLRRQAISYQHQFLYLITIPSALLLGYLIGLAIKFNAIRYNTTPYWPEKRVTINEWWQNPTDYLPIYRLNRFGSPIQPFNIQWAGNIKTISQTLSQHGWKVIKINNNIKSTLKRFASYKPENHQPILSLQYRHKPPILFLIKQIPKKKTIIEIRLWETGLSFKDSDLPLWIGSIDYHTSPKKLITFENPHRISLDNGGGVNDLIKNITTFQSKTITVKPPLKIAGLKHLDWNGAILIIRK